MLKNIAPGEGIRLAYGDSLGSEITIPGEAHVYASLNHEGHRLADLAADTAFELADRDSPPLTCVRKVRQALGLFWFSMRRLKVRFPSIDVGRWGIVSFTGWTRTKTPRV